MSKSRRITLLFILILLVGVLGFVARINHSLEETYSIEVSNQPEEILQEG